MPRLGAHMSIAGGHALAFERLARVDGEAMQIFIKNQRQWRAPLLSEEKATRFRTAWRQHGRPPVAAHNSYLINLAASDPELVARSVAALTDELARADFLGVPYLIMHPGARGIDSIETGLARFTANLDRALTKAGSSNGVMVLLETTAGQGTGLGSRFEELGTIIQASRFSGRLGVCLDTCHVFAAGYDLRTPMAYEKTFAEFDRIVGLERLLFFHLNDAKKELGSRVDRHEHIGMGKIGIEGFRLLVNDPRFFKHPMVLETPKSKDLHEDAANLAVLKGLRRS
jgi:deoxyribonuclease-4